MKYLRWFINVAKPYRWALAGSILCQLAQIAVGLGYVYISKALIDIATGDLTPAEWFIGCLGNEHVTRNALLVFGGAMLVAVILRIFLNALKSYIETKAQTKMTNSLRGRQFNNLLHLETDYRGRYHSGDIINRLQTDINTVSGAFCTSVPNLIGTSLKFVAAFTYLVILQASLAWVLVVVIPAGVLAGKFVMRKIRTYTLAVRKGDSDVQSHLQESIQHLTVIKTLEFVPNASGELDTLQDGLYGNVMKRTRFSIAARVITGIALAGGYAIAFLWGVRGIYLGTVTYGLMTAFLQLVGQLQRPVMELSNELPALFHCTASIDRLMEIEELPKEQAQNPVMLQETGGIRIENLCFTYPDGNEEIISNFNHDFKPGTRTAVVGPTGIGKSTLIKLLLALQKPTKGSIEMYDGKTSVEASSATLCNLVYVPQGNSLLSGTIRENLLMGDPDASEEALFKALHTAAADFVLESDKGLDTQCFEAGGGLSEGQAQRIAIARALLRPGSILLLDEFSSALDPATEEQLLERLTSSKVSKTMIFITHREKIAEYCDEILRFENRG